MNDTQTSSRLTCYFSNTEDETLVNYVFYTIAAVVLMAVLGVDTTAVIVGVSGILVSFAFLISNAASSYLEVSFSER